MTDNIGGGSAGAPPKNNTRTYIIVAVVVALLLCCCLALGVAGWFYGDQLVGQSSHAATTMLA